MNAQEVFQFYRGQGWSPHAAAAIAGAGGVESNYDPTAVGDNGTAFGMYQWRGDRRARLLAFARQKGTSPSDPRTQLEFHQWELTQGPEKRWGDALRQAPDVRAAAAAHISTMRPQGWTARNPMGGLGFANRYSNAARLLGQKPEDGYTGAGTGMDSPRERSGATPSGGLPGLLDTGNGLLGDPNFLAQQEQRRKSDAMKTLAMFAMSQMDNKPKLKAPIPEWNESLLHTPRGLI